MPHIDGSPADRQAKRQLPGRITIPAIRGEMIHLRPATLADLDKLDRLEAYAGAAGITGKDEASERAVVQAWVKRSVAWSDGINPAESGVGDPELRRTIAWAVLTDADHDADGAVDAGPTGNVIGMVFLIDIDGWARSARIQVLLGKDYRGRGYSRDAMPRVMTYGFAPGPSGLGLHRIWVAVPEKNARSLSVYQSLGFMPSGTSRDSLWDAEIGKYQDLIVMDTLADEYDPIRSLDAFGMHVIADNPGVQEAMAAHEHSVEIKQHHAARAAEPDESAGHGQDEVVAMDAEGINGTDDEGHMDIENAPSDRSDSQQPSVWPYAANHQKKSKRAWWRNLGRSAANGQQGGKQSDSRKRKGTDDRSDGGMPARRDDVQSNKGDKR